MSWVNQASLQHADVPVAILVWESVDSFFVKNEKFGSTLDRDIWLLKFKSVDGESRKQDADFRFRLLISVAQHKARKIFRGTWVSNPGNKHCKNSDQSEKTPRGIFFRIRGSNID